MKVIYQFPYLSITEVKLVKEFFLKKNYKAKIINFKEKYLASKSFYSKYLEIDEKNLTSCYEMLSLPLDKSLKLPIFGFGIISSSIFFSSSHFINLIQKRFHISYFLLILYCFYWTLLNIFFLKKIHLSRNLTSSFNNKKLILYI